MKHTQRERPPYIANALDHIGKPRFRALLECLEPESQNARYFAARGIGASNHVNAESILLEAIDADHEKTPFGASVSAGAEQGLKTLRRPKKIN